MSKATKTITKFQERIEKVDSQLEQIRGKITELEEQKNKVIEESLNSDTDLGTTQINDKLRGLWDREGDLHTLRDLLEQRLSSAYEDRRQELRSHAKKQKEKALTAMEAADAEVRELQHETFVLQWKMSEGYVGEPVAEVEGCTEANRGELFEAVAVADRELGRIEGMSREELVTT